MMPEGGRCTDKEVSRSRAGEEVAMVGFRAWVDVGASDNMLEQNIYSVSTSTRS